MFDITPHAFARPEKLCLQPANRHNEGPCLGRGVCKPPQNGVPVGQYALLEQRVLAALETVAVLVCEDPAYLPIFERLEKELADIERQTHAIDRARKLLQNQKAMR